VFIGGTDLGTDHENLLYCEAYGNGTFIVRGFGPAPFRMNGREGEANAAVHRAAAPGQPVTQDIALSVKGDKVACLINGTVVATYARADVVAPGKLKSTDADAVFGMEYAQAEDDFNRVETNYLNALGRLAEADGPAAIYSDLRMKLFIEPDSLRAQYRRSPAWLRRLMDAFADGLNFYLHKHPEVKPRVITRFEPWMALSFTEGSIGGDIERVDLVDLA